MEYVERGSLLDIIVQKPKQLTGKRIKRIACEVALGMTYLHGINPPLIHRDLKSANILVRHTPHARTISAITTHVALMRSCCGVVDSTDRQELARQDQRLWHLAAAGADDDDPPRGYHPLDGARGT
jgi:serine/threonine protein kinase